jgi:hypothetical protein
MDPLELYEWAQRLWQRLHAPISFQRPLLLVYSPAAERSAVRALNTLARIGRWHAPAFFFSAAGRLPVLKAIPPCNNGLYLIHCASRFLDLPAWLKPAGSHPICRHVVMTAPKNEHSQIPDCRNFELVAIPEEEAAYCDRKASEIFAKYFYGATDWQIELEAVEQILVEAGMADVAVPLTLLARHLRRDRAALIEQLHSQRLCEFLWWPKARTAANRVVAFRGRWLAEKIASNAKAGEYPQLEALVADADPTVPVERYFLLNFLVALRAQGFPQNAARLQELYSHLFQQTRQLAAACPERRAWAFFDQEACCQRYHEMVKERRGEKRKGIHQF